ncbi:MULTISPECIES: hypothetical protein [Paenibacillus]|uniref:hypothetical protein n=1 Tax=Paenibacillus TaxID=44249 RepID=UPI0022B903FB|nr:hypothetical protein [Paenibacillus caseinilyticus]MCZ8521664.1 hypothetical protein [Paenibacillus caseinilyticus]
MTETHSAGTPLPEIWPHISQLPQLGALQVNGEELTVTGGYGAGAEFIDRYHFRYNPLNKRMILISTDQVRP